MSRSGRASVEVVADVKNFASQLQKELEAALRGLKVDTSSLTRQVSADATKAGQRVAKDVQAGVGGGLSKGLAIAGAIAGAALIGGLKAASAAGAANFALGLVASLAPAVGALALLPAAMVAVQVASGALKIALSGVGDALKAGMSGDAAKFAEELEKLAPAAQAAVKAVVALKPQIDALKTAVQNSFFAPFNAQIQAAGNTYLPMLRNTLSAVAGSFGIAARESLGFLQSQAGISSVSSLLDSVRQSIANVADGLPGIVRALTTVGQVGGSFLPGLTAGFGDLTQRVADFIDKAAETGALERFISGGLDVLGQLGVLLGNIGSIITSVFQAINAAGGDVLGTLGAIVGEFAAFLNSAEGMQALTALFSVLAGVAKILGAAFAVVLPVVGELVGVLAGALAPVLPLIAGLIKQLAPVVQQVGAALGALLGPAISMIVDLLAALIPVVMPIVDVLASLLLPAVELLTPVITVLGRVVGAILGAALKALMPLIQSLVPVILQLLQTGLTPMIPAIMQLGELFMALMPAIGPLIQLFAQLLVLALVPLMKVMPVASAGSLLLVRALTAIIGPVAQVIGWVAKFISKLLESKTVKDNVSKAFSDFRAHMMTVFSAIVSFVSGAWNNLKATLRTINAVITAVIGFFTRLHLGAVARMTALLGFVRTVPGRVRAGLAAIAGVVTGVIGFFARLYSGSLGRLNALLGFVRGIPGRVRSGLAGISSAVSMAIGFFGRLASGAAGRISAMLGIVRGIGGRVRSAVGNLAGVLVGAGRAVIQGLINGISSKLGQLRAMAGSAAATIRNLFPFSPAKEGPLSGRGSPEIAGQKIAAMIADGMQRHTPQIRAAASAMASAARDGRGLDVHGRGILASALGPNRTTMPVPAAQPGPQIVFAAGSIVVQFHGVKPTEAEARRTGDALGRGIAGTLARSNVTTQVRTL